MSDSILARIAAGHSAAVDECLTRYGGLVWSLARRYCPDRTEAEDAVQEVFVEVWKSAARFDPQLSSEPAFIAMLARRRLIDRRRRGQRQPSLSPLPEESPPAAAENEAARVELCDEAAAVVRRMGELRPDERRVLELSIYDGLSQQEISERIGMPLGTVKTHARRGLARLREMLSPRPLAAPAGGAA